MKNFKLSRYLIFLILVSCVKTDSEILTETSNLNVANKNVRTYEMVELITQENLLTNYKGKFGNKEIELFKVSDSSLLFYVPDITPGEVYLNFELGIIKFNVSKTLDPEKNIFLDNISNLFDQRLKDVNNLGQSDTTDLFTARAFKQNTMQLFNSLSVLQQKEALLFYEANKDVFKQYAETIFKEIDASTVLNSIPSVTFPNLLNQQSSCPRNLGWFTFYGCTAENLAVATNELGEATSKVVEMVGMASLMGLVALNTSVLGPVAWGIAAVGISLPMGTAIYMLLMDVYPAFLRFKRALNPFLEAHWIFTKALFISVATVFSNEVAQKLNLLPSFRTIKAGDGNVNTGSANLLNALIRIRGNWEKLAGMFGDYPVFRNSEKPTTLNTNEVIITDISNPNVKLISNIGQLLTFKSVNGNDETFAYKVTVKKEGFIEEKILNATLKGIPDSTELYRQSLLGNYTLSSYGTYQLGNGPNTRIDCDIREGGYCDYTIYDDPSWPSGHKFYNRWLVQKINNEYFFTSTYTNPDHRLDVAQKLSYPVTSFVYMHRYTKK